MQRQTVGCQIQKTSVRNRLDVHTRRGDATNTNKYTVKRSLGGSQECLLCVTTWSEILAHCLRGDGIGNMFEVVGATPEHAAARYEKHLQSTGCPHCGHEELWSGWNQAEKHGQKSTKWIGRSRNVELKEKSGRFVNFLRTTKAMLGRCNFDFNEQVVDRSLSLKQSKD